MPKGREKGSELEERGHESEEMQMQETTEPQAIVLTTYWVPTQMTLYPLTPCHHTPQPTRTIMQK